MQSFEQAAAFIGAIGATGQIVDFRAIHDANKAIPAIPFRDTLENAWPSIVHYNNQGYGCFAVIAQMDGIGRELSNVRAIRANYVDLDNVSAEANRHRANSWFPAPAFAVNSSAGKYHIYWPVVGYSGNDRFEGIQRKLRQLFDGDGSIIDATRVMRLPGTLNTKYSNPASNKYVPGAQPHLVTCFGMAGAGYVTSAEQLENALHDVNVIDSGGTRHELGDPALAAPSLDWLVYALNNIDPNLMNRGEWITVTAAIKQAGWALADETRLYEIWSQWCARYDGNDLGENLKQWNSIRNTEVGWPAIERRLPTLKAERLLGGSGNVPTAQPSPTQPTLPDITPQPSPNPSVPEPPAMDCRGEMLTAQEQQIWFKDCTLVEKNGEILTPSGRMMNSTKFNAAYGGKIFIVTTQGKVTNEPWQAATRSTLWTVPKVDHIRFLPSQPYGERLRDDLGRYGVNVYRPAIIEQRDGDPAPFLQAIERIMPVASDRKILFDFLAHNARFPGFKIPWAPVIQSAEGVGKGIIKAAMEHVMGYSYTHFPNAKELADSGGKFNAWMRHKLFILADEIKVDDQRDMIEVLKPLISEESIEIQGKGENQEKEDNFANWSFFTNYKNAVPVAKHGRRYAIFYSAIQSTEDLERLGMNEAYFNWLYAWFKHAGGKQIVAKYLLNYPIERGAISMRAPQTSSTPEALKQSRGPIEQLIYDAIEDQLPGFRGGWVSTIACHKLVAASGHRSVSPKTITAILEAMQYYDRGRAPRPFFSEDPKTRSTLYHVDRNADVAFFGAWQGYGDQ